MDDIIFDFWEKYDAMPRDEQEESLSQTGLGVTFEEKNKDTMFEIAADFLSDFGDYREIKLYTIFENVLREKLEEKLSEQILEEVYQRCQN